MTKRKIKLKEIKETPDIDIFVSFIVESYERPVKEKAKIGKRLVRASDNLVNRYRMNSKYNFKADLFETMRDNGKEVNVARLVYDYSKEHTDKETSEEYVKGRLNYIQKELYIRNSALESKLYDSGDILEIASHEK